jgi:hypothetical protein
MTTVLSSADLRKAAALAMLGAQRAERPQAFISSSIAGSGRLLLTKMIVVGGLAICCIRMFGPLDSTLTEHAIELP